MVNLIMCIVVGLVSGYFASQMLNSSRGGPILNFVLGVAGALLAGYLFMLGGASRASGVTFWSVFVAIAGAVVFLGIKHAVLGNHPVRT